MLLLEIKGSPRLVLERLRSLSRARLSLEVLHSSGLEKAHVTCPWFPGHQRLKLDYGSKLAADCSEN